MVDWKSQYLGQVEMACVAARKLEEDAKRLQRQLKSIDNLPPLNKANDCILQQCIAEINYSWQQLSGSVMRGDMISSLAKHDFKSEEAGTYSVKE